MRRLGIDSRLKVRAAMSGALQSLSPRAQEDRRIARAMEAPVDNTPLFSVPPPRHIGVYRTECIKPTRPKRHLCLEEDYCMAFPRMAAALYRAWHADHDFELLY